MSLKIENLHTYGWADAIRGMRNPLNSWEKADTTFEFDPSTGSLVEVKFGPNDLSLVGRLVKGGSPHRKFLRQILVTMDITAPSYWWAEMDTYKVATTRDSCSIQHKGSSRDFVQGDFSLDSLPERMSEEKADLEKVIDIVNKWRRLYVETGDYRYFRLMRQLLPSGYNYRSTWSGNLETIANILEWRKNHRLSEWHEFCAEVEKIPGYKETVGNA